MDKALVKKSKFLSLVLRHQPEKINLQLDASGWALIDELLIKAKQNGVQIDLLELTEIVENNDKQRFCLSDDGKKIRANQGHSIGVELNLQEQAPPEFLYHGSARKNLQSILQSGIHKGNRHHVHLSNNCESARQVGQRHGKPIVFKILAQEMYQQDFIFYRSPNGVWLVEYIPAEFIVMLD